MALSEESIRFLEENHAQNSREWFLANRERYLLYVEKPMLELAGALAPVINAIDPLLNVRPERVLTRIRRDTRFSRDKSLYKRSLWLVFQRARGMVGPLWFFEFNADMHRFGCGYYSAPARDMARIRELVVSDDKRFFCHGGQLLACGRRQNLCRHERGDSPSVAGETGRIFIRVPSYSILLRNSQRSGRVRSRSRHVHNENDRLFSPLSKASRISCLN